MNGDVLCHPDAEKSCGACCGMYNRVDSSESATLGRLRRRTAAFFEQADVSDRASLDAFRGEWEETREGQKLLSGLPNCPFLGLVDFEESAAPSKVGCLVHPLQNDGDDGRDCGVYDRQTCHEYLCAAHDLLDAGEKLLVTQAVHDSYLYGLVITDVQFVRQLLARATEMNGMEPRAEQLHRPAALRAAGRYFELKRQWPFAADDAVFGQVRPGEGLETCRREPPAASHGLEADPVDAVLTCLGTAVQTCADLHRARSMVRTRIEAFARAVALPTRPR